MNEATNMTFWEIVRGILEAMGVILVPFIGWVMITLLSHNKQIIRLEEKVNDSLNRRMTSLENRVVSMEEKLECKIDTIEKNVIDCKLAINEKGNALSGISEKIDLILKKIVE